MFKVIQLDSKAYACNHCAKLGMDLRNGAKLRTEGEWLIEKLEYSRQRQGLTYPFRLTDAD